jgi:MATE family multidrug resistance protein
MLVFAIFTGMNGAIESLVSVAYGREEYKQCGLHLQSSRIINTVFLIPIIIVLLFTKYILVAMGMNVEVATYAQEYLIYAIPGLWAMMLLDSARRFF